MCLDTHGYLLFYSKQKYNKDFEEYECIWGGIINVNVFQKTIRKWFINNITRYKLLKNIS